MKLDLNKVLARVSNNVGLVHASLLDSKEITPNVYKVVVSFNSAESDADQRFNAIASLFDNSASPIEESFREIAGAYKYTVCGFVANNVESKSYTEEMASSGKYKTIAGNILMDESDDTMWEVTSSGSEKFLVRKTQENLKDLVALASIKNQIPKYQQSGLNSVISTAKVADYISYVDQETCSIKYGYVLAAEDFQDDEEPQLEVLDRDSLETVQVNPELVVDAAFLNGTDADNLPSSETASDYDSKSVESMKAYYKQMFSHAPEYYKHLEDIISKHAAI